MAHDKHTVHVSHYTNSPTWRSAIAPEDRSWLLFIDVTGAPHLYLATETQNAEGQTVTTYAPCVRAMLRPEDGAEAASMLPGVAAARAFTITVGPTPSPECPLPFVAVSGSSAMHGNTPRAAVAALLPYLPDDFEDAAKGAAALAL